MGQEGDSYFNELKRRVKNLLWKKITVTAPWISDATWRLEDHRTALGRKFTANQRELKMERRRFQAALKKDSRYMVRKAGGGLSH